METCLHCSLPIPEDVYDVYCTRQCFDDAIDNAIRIDKEQARPSLLNRLYELRNDALQRVSNIDSFNSKKLEITRAYFQARVDILNEILIFITHN